MIPADNLGRINHNWIGGVFIQILIEYPRWNGTSDRRRWFPIVLGLNVNSHREGQRNDREKVMGRRMIDTSRQLVLHSIISER